MIDYNKIFKIKEIKLEELDCNTLIDWNCLKFDDENWLCIEVWLDESMTIKCLETSEDETICINDMLTKEQKEYLDKIVNIGIDKFINK